MLTRKMSFAKGCLAALFGAVAAWGGAACGGGGQTNGCTPGQQSECACPGGGASVQACNAQGTYDACQCGDENRGGGGSGAGDNSGGGGAGQGGGGGTKPDDCGNGIPDPGECDGSPEFPDCPQDCMGGQGGAGGNACADVVTYAGMVTNVPSAWGSHMSANGKAGYDAGVEICKTIGADHPCEYAEVTQAEMKGELSTVAQGTNAWIHRATVAMIGGTPTNPGPGGRCNDWTYITNHISDGEYVTFDMVGIPTYHLDNDTFYDGVDTTHTIIGDLQCGGMMRALLCCYPTCVP